MVPCMIASPSEDNIFYLLLINLKFLWTEMDFLLFKKITIKIHMNQLDLNKLNIIIFMHAKLLGRLLKNTRGITFCFWPTEKRSQHSQSNFFAWTCLIVRGLKDKILMSTWKDISNCRLLFQLMHYKIFSSACWSNTKHSFHNHHHLIKT